MPRTAVRVLWAGPTDSQARRLRDAGHEVVALGDGVAPEEIAAVAEQEDVVAVAVTDAEVGAAVARLVAEDVVVFRVT